MVQNVEWYGKQPIKRKLHINKIKCVFKFNVFNSVSVLFQNNQSNVHFER